LPFNGLDRAISLLIVLVLSGAFAAVQWPGVFWGWVNGYEDGYLSSSHRRAFLKFHNHNNNNNGTTVNLNSLIPPFMLQFVE